MTRTQYYGANCTNEVASKEFDASIQVLSEPPDTPGATAFDIVDGYGGGGPIGWEADALVGGTFFDSNEYTDRFSIFKIEGSSLSVGISAGGKDGRSAATRHTTFAPYVYRRR